MDTIIIVAIVANTVSILTLIASAFLQMFENRKSRYVTKITTETIERNGLVRKCAATILSLTNPLRLSPQITLTTEERNSLIEAVSKLEIQFVIIIQREVEILTLMRQLINSFVNYLSAPSDELRAVVVELRDRFHINLSIYDYADWRYIKAQIKGQKNSDDFEKMCDEMDLCFSRAQQTVKLPDWETIK